MSTTSYMTLAQLLEDWCVHQDALSKGESMTTKAIRNLIKISDEWPVMVTIKEKIDEPTECEVRVNGIIVFDGVDKSVLLGNRTSIKE